MDASVIECQQIPIDELLVGRWYVGRGRNANIGLWDGDCFLVIALQGRRVGWGPRDWISHPWIKGEPYFTAEGGCFQPFKLVDEGVPSEVIEVVYARTLMFGNNSIEKSERAEEFKKQLLKFNDFCGSQHDGES